MVKRNTLVSARDSKGCKLETKLREWLESLGECLEEKYKVSWLCNGLIALLENVLGKRQEKVDEQAVTQQLLFLKCITQPDSPVIIEHLTMRRGARQKRHRERGFGDLRQRHRI